MVSDVFNLIDYQQLFIICTPFCLQLGNLNTGGLGAASHWGSKPAGKTSLDSGGVVCNFKKSH